MNAEQAKKFMLAAAKDGDRVVQVVEPKPKTICGGLGNRSGSLSYAFFPFSCYSMPDEVSYFTFAWNVRVPVAPAGTDPTVQDTFWLVLSHVPPVASALPVT